MNNDIISKNHSINDNTSHIVQAVKILLVLTASLFIFSGCNNKEKEIEDYKNQMSAYYDQIYTAGVSLNSIVSSNNIADSNSASENSVSANSINASSCSEALYAIDCMTNAISGIDSLTPPAKYAQVKDFSTAALQNIMNASALFHEIYASEDFSSYDDTKAQTAMAYYNNALDNVSYIGQVLSAQ